MIRSSSSFGPGVDGANDNEASSVTCGIRAANLISPSLHTCYILLDTTHHRRFISRRERTIMGKLEFNDLFSGRIAVGFDELFFPATRDIMYRESIM